MKKDQIKHLYNLELNEPYELNVTDDVNEIEKGNIFCGDITVPIVNKIPRFVESQDITNQEQTIKSFSYKWETANEHYGNNIDENEDKTFNFMVDTEPVRYGFNNIIEMREHYQNAERMLEVGCGSGHYTSLFLTSDYKGEYIGVDLSRGIDIAAKRNKCANSMHIQASLFDLPFREEYFDLVHCRGVMHHTPNTKKAFNSIVRHLKPGGEFIFLIYRKNNQIREFTDNFIRESIKNKAPDEAWDLLMELTNFGNELHKIKSEIKLEKGMRLFDIPPGTYSLHMLIYNYFLKAFYKDGWSNDENNIITFDWYHPEYVFRHTKQEIYNWCEEHNLEIKSFDDRWVGYTVRAVKKD
jgi:ubiquinone/menaquinone biosynthesis C-methylase UbiE